MSKIAFDNFDPDIYRYDQQVHYGQGEVFPSLRELLDFLDQYDLSGCYFRGQAGLWNVSSSLFRHIGTERFEKAQRTASAALVAMKRNTMIGQVIQDNDHYAMAIAQHYGCPTDLIDLTTDPRVAGYFASAENSAHENMPMGCIWAFTEHDLEYYQSMVNSSIQLGELPAELVDTMLKHNNGSLLLKLDIPLLSRLNAQKGLFLWDAGGSMNRLIQENRYGSCFYFRHTPDEKKMFAADDGILFPLPNELESELMRIFTEASRENGLPEYIGPIADLIREYTSETKNGLLSAAVDQAEDSVFLPLPDLFTPSFGPYPWQRRALHGRKVHPNHIDTENCVECILPLTEGGILPFVEDVLSRLEQEALVDFRIFLKAPEGGTLYAMEKPLDVARMVINLNNYSYSRDEITRILLEYFRMWIFRHNEGYITKTQTEYQVALASGEVKPLLEAYYGCPVTKIDLKESGNRTSFWLPSDHEFLDRECSEEFGKFPRDCLDIPAPFAGLVDGVADNAKIFLCQSDPRKIISWESMREMFIRFVLPQHFAFRPQGELLYILDHITAMTLPFFGRTLYLA